jgi:predicted CXXCH cytochrome family protein
MYARQLPLQEGMMRHRHTARALFALLFALGLVIGAASAAYASTESTYAAWAGSGLTGIDELKAYHSTTHETPHNGYTTSTTKCAVCHAVHKAPADGELLLRTTVGEACVYCHIDTDLGVIQIYDGKSSLYYADNKNNHSRDGGAPCSGCHSVHGANTYGTKLTTKILKRLPIQPELLQFFAGEDSATPNPDMLYEAVGDPVNDRMYGGHPYEWEEWGWTSGVQQTAFCTGCHPYYTRASEDPITTNRMIVDGAISTDTRTFASHPMKRQWNGLELNGDWIFSFEASGSTLPIVGTRVARMSTNGCYRCHGENEDTNLSPGVQESSFPHYSTHRERFLMSSDVGGNWLPDTPDSRQDGTCFYCHSWDWGTPEGVGFTY